MHERLDPMRYKALGVCLTTVLVGLALPVPWRLAALRAVPQPASQRPAANTGSAQTAGNGTAPAVRPAPAGQRFAGKPGVRGATYYGFEAQAARVTTHFGDAIVVARRAVDGDIDTVVSDASGSESAKMKVDPVDASTTVLRYTPTDGTPLHAYGDPNVRPTLEWANRQAYVLWKDRAGGSVDALEWRGDIIRRGAASREDPAARITAIDTEWANGLSSKAVRRPIKTYQPVKNHTVSGEVLITHLSQAGTEIGTLNWFPSAGLLTWDLPGLTRGFIAPEHLKDFGGWPFAPDLHWLNLQAFAFHHYKLLIQSRGFVAQGPSNWPGRVIQFFAPTLRADEPGCDDLHWLDGTVLRYCCDVHDFCYEKNGCSARSWWRVWTSWTCDFCNAWVVSCFLSGGSDWSNIGTAK